MPAIPQHLRRSRGPIAFVTMSGPSGAMRSPRASPGASRVLRAIADRELRVAVVRASGRRSAPATTERDDRARRRVLPAALRDLREVMETIQAIPSRHRRGAGMATALGASCRSCDLAVAAARPFARRREIGLFCTTPMVALTRGRAKKAWRCCSPASRSRGRSARRRPGEPRVPGAELRAPPARCGPHVASSRSSSAWGRKPSTTAADDRGERTPTPRSDVQRNAADSRRRA